MKDLRQVFLGIIIALASIGLLLGGFSLSLAEGNSAAISTPSPTSSPTSPPASTLTPIPTLTPTSSPTWQPFTPSATTSPALDSPTPFPTWVFSLTPTPPAPPTNCPPPLGWLVYFVQPGETLDSIATRYQISSADLQNANCLSTTVLIPGAVIYIPSIRTQTPLPCGAPNNWIVYHVRPGDTLYRLSLDYGVPVAGLQRANCLGASTLLHPGQLLYVPPWPAHTATSTSPYMIFPTSTQANPAPATYTSPATSMPTDTLFPVASDTPGDAPSATAIQGSP